MCIVIDTNVLGPVFNKKNVDHKEFIPVLNWIFNGPGKIVYGGTKYLDEIGKFRRIFQLLNKVNKAVYISNNEVDLLTKSASEAIIDNDFDDQHLVGLLLASGCRLICTNDFRAIPFLQHRQFFKRSLEPKIYINAKNAKLLNPKYWAECCGTCVKSTNKQKEFLEFVLKD